MLTEKLSRCPVCGGVLEKGFSIKNHGLSWIPAEKMKRFAFMDQDLNEAGFRQYFPARASYELSYHCPKCKLYIVDYGTSLSKKEAQEAADTLVRQAGE